MKNMKRKILAATISASLVLGSVAVLAPSAAMAAQTAVVESGVNFRTAPSTSSSKIRLLKTGEKLTVLSKTNNYWYKVKDSKGKTGYVSSQSKYITVNGSTSPGNSNAGSGSGNVTPAPASGSVEKVIAAGMKYMGTPYQYGSSRSTTTTFDCSDFVRQAFLDGVGIKLAADSRGQGKYVKDKGNAVSNWKQLKRGDLMFFMSYKGTSASAYSGVNKSTARITHDGIYLGDGKILHTYSTKSGGVTISDIAGTHWEKRFLFGGSAL